ncbi:hypothetical protein COCNU_scaffold000670G000010 [Cocos nucifera]|nr:hypothetical protein [Cocos nucifera]
MKRTAAASAECRRPTSARPAATDQPPLVRLLPDLGASTTRHLPPPPPAQICMPPPDLGGPPPDRCSPTGSQASATPSRTTAIGSNLCPHAISPEGEDPIDLPCSNYLPGRLQLHACLDLRSTSHNHRLDAAARTHAFCRAPLSESTPTLMTFLPGEEDGRAAPPPDLPHLARERHHQPPIESSSARRARPPGHRKPPPRVGLLIVKR